jgi:CBS domain-containing protein
MPTIDQLLVKLNKKGEVVLDAKPEDSIQSALNKMFQHDFSQLPVINGDGTFSLITTESVLRMLASFGTKINDAAKVKTACVVISNRFQLETDLFELNKEIAQNGIALITDSHQNLTNIITTYDTTRYFQEWSEDTMFLGDVERGLKDLITSSFKRSDGVIDLIKRKNKVESAFLTNPSFYKKFQSGMKYYFHNMQFSAQIDVEAAGLAFLEFINKIESNDLDILTEDSSNVSQSVQLSDRLRIKQSQDLYKKFYSSLSLYLRKTLEEKSQNERLILESFNNAFRKNDDEGSEYDTLTLGQYIQLFFSECWDRCEEDLSEYGKDSIKFMLDGVRKTRNDLAHFHEESITAQQRVQLRNCYSWLQNNKRIIQKSLERTAEDSSKVDIAPASTEISQPLSSAAERAA